MRSTAYDHVFKGPNATTARYMLQNVCSQDLKISGYPKRSPLRAGDSDAAHRREAMGDGIREYVLRNPIPDTPPRRPVDGRWAKAQARRS